MRLKMANLVPYGALSHEDLNLLTQISEGFERVQDAGHPAPAR